MKSDSSTRRFLLALGVRTWKPEQSEGWEWEIVKDAGAALESCGKVWDVWALNVLSKLWLWDLCYGLCAWAFLL